MDHLTYRGKGSKTECLSDETPRAPFMAATECAVCVHVCEFIKCVGQRQVEKVKFSNQFLNSVTLSPAHDAMQSGVALHRLLNGFKVLGIEGDAQPFEDFGKMVSELLVRQLVRLDKVYVANDRPHPLLSQTDLFEAKEVGESPRRAYVFVGHKREIGGVPGHQSLLP
jgi:hypothetical protein